MDFAALVRDIPDFPKKGILFRDITTLIKDTKAFPALIDAVAASLRDKQVDLVVGPEARGFVMGSAVAYALGAGFVMARKPGKLPAATRRIEYGLEYGADVMEMHEDAIKPGQRIALVDDLLATGGTAMAVIKLCEEMGGEIVGARFAIELTDLNGRELLKDYDAESVIQY
ncbi:MAG: adenine phosphoribosyltransferase [Clostridiales bacterium]|nr:adenine phosphoribosyltransferase [Clostridiales bacterium]